ncbi:MAG: hypothetical protein ABSA26_05405 [Thermoguttaceae bacterium]
MVLFQPAPEHCRHVVQEVLPVNFTRETASGLFVVGNNIPEDVLVRNNYDLPGRLDFTI